MDDRDRQAIRHRQGLCPAAPPLGGGAHPCLAEPQSPLGQGCREDDRERGNLAIYCQRQAHVAPSGHDVTPRREPVLSCGVAQAIRVRLLGGPELALISRPQNRGSCVTQEDRTPRFGFLPWASGRRVQPSLKVECLLLSNSPAKVRESFL